MTTRKTPLICIVVLLTAAVALAEVTVTIDRNATDRASAEFKFGRVPQPAKNDAAAGAKFTIVDGARDRNGAGAEALNDDALPNEGDQPDANFFFAQNADGGRILVDLGKSIEVKQINTYSWHPNTRGPQVYTVYGSDGTGEKFNLQPKRPANPEECGWKKLASVDTKQGDAGGQHGVSVANADGALGSYRYLLFDVRRTEDADPFGNTFYSEIDVIDAAGPAVAAIDQSRPAAAGTAILTEGPITIDYTEMPELKDWVEGKLMPTLVKWYPIIVEQLPSENYVAPQRFTVTFRKNMSGVAATAGTRVFCAGRWFSQNLEGEAVGAVVHELVHVAQQYRSRGNPGWLVEGVADYIRWFQYEPASKRPRPNPDRAKYTDSYRTTAAFLNYLVEKHDKEIVRKFNVAMRQSKYSPELWKQYTGKTVDELWDEYIQTLKKQ